MLISRRHFVQALLGITGSAFLPLPLAAAANAPNIAGRKLVVGLDNAVCVVDIGSREIVNTLDIGFKPHSFVPLPSNPNKLWVIERSRFYDQRPDQPDAAYQKPGEQRFHAVEVDMSTMTRQREIAIADGAEFRGHGFFAPGTENLFIGRTDLKGQGFLTGFDIDTGKIIRDIAVPNGSVHECALHKDGTALVASSGQLLATDKTQSRYVRDGSGGITQIDLKDGKVASFTPINDHTQLPGHFRMLSDGRIIVVAQADDNSGVPGRVFFGKLGHALTAVPFNDKVPPGSQGEMFGIAVNESKGIAAISNYVNNVVIIMDIKKGVFLRQFPFEVLNVNFDPVTGNFFANGKTIGLLDTDGKHIETLLNADADAKGIFRSGHSYFM